MTPAELKEKIVKDESIILIDIREPYEFEEVNIGATLIPMGDLIPRISELEIHKDREIVLHCQSGNRSAAACEALKLLGFSNVSHLEGGIKAFLQV